MKKNIIFDLDGTLLDTLEDLKDSTNHILTANGFPERSSEEIRSFVGNGVKKLLERALPDGFERDEAFVDRLYADFSKYYNAHCEIKTAPYEGVEEMLNLLKQNDCKIAIVSNKIDSAVKELSNKYFGDKISVAIGEKPDIKPKPAPDTVYSAMKELGASKKDSIYIGDSEVDIETARNAGIPCISVLWGFRDEEFLRDRGGEVFVRTVDELASKLLKD